VGPAKVVVKAAKDNDKLTIKGGVLDGKSLSVSEVEALSKLPGLEELRSKFLGVLQAVPSKLVRTLNEPARSFAAVLNARKEALESGEA
jgi:large subunit ribosomal protein L10